MQHSPKPYEELELAKKLIEEMKVAKTLAELEAFWKRYLHHLDRIWNKAEANFSRSPKWGGWHGKYIRLRKNDQLLAYFINARNADEHSISEITEKQPGLLSISPIIPGGMVHIKKMIFGPAGEITHFEMGSPCKIEEIASRVNLLPVVNRGRTYPAPTEHLGQVVKSSDLIDLAIKGVRFYGDFLDAAEKFFVS